jgi:hypothetical protein
MNLSEQDMNDIRSVINEQYSIIQQLKPLIYSNHKIPQDFQGIYEEILDCNKIMMEIISGPSGTIERMI